MGEISQPPEVKQSDTQDSKSKDRENYPKLLSRRTLLKRAFFGLGAVTAAAATGKLGQVVLEHPELIEKTARSISSGKIIEDIQEVIESRLGVGAGEVTVTNFDAEGTYPLEEWMTEVADEVTVLELTRNNEKYPLLLVDITDSVSAVPVIKKEVQPKDGTFPRVYHDLGETVAENKILTLPGPQFQMQAQTEQKVPHYLQYLMYAWSKDQPEKGSLECTGKRGGVVVRKDGQTIVASPEEFFSYYQENAKGNEVAQTLIEYAFVIDSNDLQGSFDALTAASSTLLKDLSQTVAYTNSLVTMYKEDGSFKTYLLAAYEPELTNTSGASGESSVRGMNPVQLASIAEQLRENTGGSRFILSLSDPSPEASNCYGPWSLTEDELQEKGYGYEPAQYQDWMNEMGVEKKYTRAIGSTDSFAFPQYSLPWVLATKKN